MKALWSKLTGRLPLGVTTVISILVLVITLVTGGKTTQVFTGKNGAEYKTDFTVPKGAEELIDKCNFKKAGDTCPVSFDLILTMTKAPDVPAEVTPAAEPVKQPEAVNKIDEVKKEGVVKVPAEVKEVPITEVKKVDQVK